jgi:hypothetical protein
MQEALDVIASEAWQSPTYNNLRLLRRIAPRNDSIELKNG